MTLPDIPHVLEAEGVRLWREGIRLRIRPVLPPDLIASALDEQAAQALDFAAQLEALAAKVRRASGRPATMSA